jgi:DNA-binding MarR family transcriptional regulator
MVIPKISLRYAYALHLLSKTGPMYASQLARALGVNPVTISNMVNSLKPKGFISWSHKEPRRNLLWIEVTDAGKEIIKGLFK